MQPRPPGSKRHFLIGNLPLASRDPFNVFTNGAREYGDIFYYRAAWIHAEQMLLGWQDGATIDVYQEMMNLTLRIIVRALFGLEAEDSRRISAALNTDY